MNREDLLSNAIDRVQQRTVSHDGLENSFRLIADLWTTYLHGKFGPLCPVITPTDVALMMDLLKTARLAKNPTHLDSWIDKAGYAACGAEVSDA